MLGLFGRFRNRHRDNSSRRNDEPQPKSSGPESSANLPLDELDELWDRHSKVLQRGIRRLSLAQREQKEALDRIEVGLHEVRDADTSDSVSFPRSEVLAILDDLDRAERGGDDTDAVARAVTRCVERICSNAKWTPIARIGHEYARSGTEIVDSVATQGPAGVVREVVRQGYCGPGERLIREAKVVVSAAAGPRDVPAPDAEAQRPRLKSEPGTKAHE